jgi:hypothetical protein
MTRFSTGAYGLMRETPGGALSRGSKPSSERVGMLEAVAGYLSTTR